MDNSLNVTFLCEVGDWIISVIRGSWSFELLLLKQYVAVELLIESLKKLKRNKRVLRINVD